MYLKQISAGENIPDDIYAVIEIPAHSNPVKYEVNKETGCIFVDRFILTPMFYPCNYGYVNNTIALDGDPIDILVITPHPLCIGCIIRCRPIGMLDMVDESGEDSKIIAVPHDIISKQYKNIRNIDDLSNILKNKISYFFEHYKDLDSNKWVKIKNWKNVNDAKTTIIDSVKRFKNKNN